MEKYRCSWASNINDQIIINYHDNEFGIMIDNQNKLFELLALEIMQTGLSWRIVLYKRKALNEAFCNFNLKKIAMMNDQDIDYLIQNYDIIKNRMKLKAIINNAQVIVDQNICLKEFIIENFKRYQDDYNSCVKEYKKIGFKFIGPSILKSLYEALGLIEAHEINCFCRKRD